MRNTTIAVSTHGSISNIILPSSQLGTATTTTAWGHSLVGPGPCALHTKEQIVQAKAWPPPSLLPRLQVLSSLASLGLDIPMRSAEGSIK